MTIRFVILVALLRVLPVGAFLAPSRPIKFISTQFSSGMPHLHWDEPNELDSNYIKKEEHDPKHSSFHVEHGIDIVDVISDPVHSIRHHLIDVDHQKLDDLGLKAQKAWIPVNVHEVEVDGMKPWYSLCTSCSFNSLPCAQVFSFFILSAVSVAAFLFTLFAAVLFGAGLCG